MKTHLAPTESLTVVIDDKEITVTAQQLLGLKQAETTDPDYRWKLCKEVLPEVRQTKKGYWENEELVLIKWDKYQSFELAVLIRINGALVWEIPDHGNAEMSEVSQWLQIPPLTLEALTYLNSEDKIAMFGTDKVKED
jgi:hypothetical protein